MATGRSATRSRAEADRTGAWLIGVRIDPNAPTGEGQAYTVLLEAPDEAPLLRRGRILLFSDASDANRALRMDDDPAVRLIIVSSTIPYTVYDVPQVLEELSSSKDAFSHPGAVVDLVNLFLDCARAASLAAPGAFSEQLAAAADHLTFSADVRNRERQLVVDRPAVKDALMWYLGALLTSSTWL